MSNASAPPERAPPERAPGSYGPAALSADLQALGFDVSRETLHRLERYATLLGRWQPAQNLVAADTLADLWRRHMLDSLQLLAFLPRPPARPLTLLDIGSGAGFPGLALAAALADRAAVHLVESNGRKATFLRTAARAMGLVVTVHNTRIEALTPFAVDVVTSRACAPLKQLLPWAAPFLGPGACCCFPKGAQVEKELGAARQYWHFTLEQHRSRSDPRGTILIIRDLLPGADKGTL